MVNLSFIGDIGLNDDYIHLKSKGLNPFKALSSHLSAADLVIGNLECVLKGDEGENMLKRPRISTTHDTLHYLKDINLGLASLATNHVYDNLTDGFQKTISFLNTHGIATIGAGMNSEMAKSSFAISIKGISFCFFNYITRDTNPSMPENAGIALNEFSEEKCLADLKNASGYDYRIVLLHWGGHFEGGLFPGTDQASLGRKLIDHGADLIIGHHTHTLQPFDRYKGKYIFYSLGNFCFADIHFEGKIRSMSSLRERESMLVNVKFNRSGYQVNFVPFRNERLFLVIRKTVALKFWLRNVFWLIVKTHLCWLFYRWWFNNCRPIILQLSRKDQNKSLLLRILSYLWKKIKNKTCRNKCENLLPKI
ncbi:MAG: CapA family protein [Bacteroidales bacterium]|nr:CapA family protein [Bacteroidales bacterium]